jgi:peptidoglycan/LPS O-acetylase OafA/YrhL
MINRRGDFLKRQLTINDYIQDRNNNFDCIRFLAAVLVIFSHAYPLTAHKYDGEFLVSISNNQWSMGALAVAIFFIISGFLISQSYERSLNLMTFIKARMLRIIPGLIVAALFGTFIIGTLVTTLPVKEYLTNQNTYHYLRVIFLFPMQFTLPGVFENSSFNNSINGSLWTIPLEILCYGIVAILGFIGLLKYKKVVLWIFLLSLYAKKYLMVYLYPHSFFDLFPFFAVGMLIYSYKDKIVLNKWNAMLSFFMIIISLKFGGFVEIFTIFGAYLIFYFAYNKKIKLSEFSKYGDFSYGIYVYAFPIQQTVTYFNGIEISVFMNIVVSLPITLIIAFFSWHLIEKPALNLKRIKVNKFSKSSAT